MVVGTYINMKDGLINAQFQTVEDFSCPKCGFRSGRVTQTIPGTQDPRIVHCPKCEEGQILVPRVPDHRHCSVCGSVVEEGLYIENSQIMSAGYHCTQCPPSADDDGIYEH